MKISCSTIRFRIDIDFEDCDVDMVYNEIKASSNYMSPIHPGLLEGAPKHKLVGKKTPKAASVEFALSWLMGYVDRNKMCTTDSKQDKDYTKKVLVTKDGFTYQTSPDIKTELEDLGIIVVSTYGLMMGTCHLICEVDSKIFSRELINKAEKIVNRVFKKYVKYYKNTD